MLNSCSNFLNFFVTLKLLGRLKETVLAVKRTILTGIGTFKRYSVPWTDQVSGSAVFGDRGLKYKRSKNVFGCWLSCQSITILLKIVFPKAKVRTKMACVKYLTHFNMRLFCVNKNALPLTEKLPGPTSKASRVLFHLCFRPPTCDLITQDGF